MTYRRYELRHRVETRMPTISDQAYNERARELLDNMQDIIDLVNLLNQEYERVVMPYAKENMLPYDPTQHTITTDNPEDIVFLSLQLSSGVYLKENLDESN